jgi:hypothetical protein
MHRPFTQYPAQRACFPPRVGAECENGNRDDRENHDREHERQNQNDHACGGRNEPAKEAAALHGQARAVTDEFEMWAVCKHSSELALGMDGQFDMGMARTFSRASPDGQKRSGHFLFFQDFRVALRNEPHQQGLAIFQHRPLDEARVLAHQFQCLGLVDMRLLRR